MADIVGAGSAQENNNGSNRTPKLFGDAVLQTRGNRCDRSPCDHGLELGFERERLEAVATRVEVVTDRVFARVVELPVEKAIQTVESLLAVERLACLLVRIRRVHR